MSNTTKPGDRVQQAGWIWEVTEIVGDKARTRRVGKVIEVEQDVTNASPRKGESNAE